MTEADLAKIIEAVRETQPTACLEKCIYKNNPAHDKAHSVLDAWIENDLAKKARYEKIKATVIGGLLISAAGAIGTGFLTSLTYLRDHLK